MNTRPPITPRRTSTDDAGAEAVVVEDAGQAEVLLAAVGAQADRRAGAGAVAVGVGLGDDDGLVLPDAGGAALAEAPARRAHWPPRPT